MLLSSSSEQRVLTRSYSIALAHPRRTGHRLVLFFSRRTLVPYTLDVREFPCSHSVLPLAMLFPHPLVHAVPPPLLSFSDITFVVNLYGESSPTAPELLLLRRRRFFHFIFLFYLQQSLQHSCAHVLQSSHVLHSHSLHSHFFGSHIVTDFFLRSSLSLPFFSSFFLCCCLSSSFFRYDEASSPRRSFLRVGR